MLRAELIANQDHRISEVVERESARLRNFIARQIDDVAEAEDILQDVFYEYVLAARMMESVERAGAWLFRVAKNRIIDRFRKKRAVTFSEMNGFEDLLPSSGAGPEAAYARTLLLEKLQAALRELTPEQREAFVAHEIEGRDFKDIAAETGATVNALILRKRQAVLHLRRRLGGLHDYFSKA
jgi:RNA polymerase sigma factor (sigma-70 family)